MKRILNNIQGVSLISVLIFGTVITSSIAYFALNNNHRMAASRTADTIMDDTVLTGYFIYAENLLLKKKCVNLNTGIDVQAENCNWTTEGNLARLLLPTSTAQKLQELENTSEPIKKTKITLNVQLDLLAGDHPIRIMMDATPSLEIDKAVIEYSVKDNSFIENVFETSINVKIMNKTEVAMEGEYITIISPRMINTYAMAINRNLTIGNGVVGAMNDPDQGMDEGRIINRIPNHVRNEDSGIKFHSPVFVNNNIYLPQADVDGNTEAVFRAPLYFGGELFTYDGASNPNSFAADMDEKYLNNFSGYKGIRGGLVPANHDEGLRIAFAREGATLGNETLKECVSFSKRKYESRSVKNSKIVLKRESDRKVTFGLTKMNEFTSKDSNNFSPQSSNILTHSEKGSDLDRSGAPVIRLEILEYTSNWNDYDHDFYIKTSNGKHKLDNDSSSQDIKDMIEELVLHKPNPEAYEDVRSFDLSDDDGVYKLKLNDLLGIKKSILDDFKDEYEDWKDNEDFDELEKPSLPVSDLNDDVFLEIKLRPGSGPSQLEFEVDIDGSIPSGYEVVFPLEMKMFVYNFLTKDNGEVVNNGSGWGPNNHSEDERDFLIEIDDGDVELKTAEGNSISSNWRYLDGGSFDYNGLPSDEKESLSSSAEDYGDKCKLEDIPNSDNIASLDLDLVPNSFTSWNYNPISLDFQYNPINDSSLSSYQKVYNTSTPDSSYGNILIVDDHNHVLFHIYSVMDKCVIKKDAEYFFGFNMCRRFVVESRTKPLELIGSLVVDQLEIHPDALAAGINVRNIFHPKSAKLLKQLGVLRSDCDSDPNKPFWHPTPDQKELERIKDCDPASLMQKADPFRWTSFEPECGLDPEAHAAGDYQTKCLPKGLYKNFISVPLSTKVYE